MFAALVAIHVPAGLVAVAAGAIAALAPKRPGRHPTAGRAYLCALAVVALTAAALALLRWPHDNHLLALDALAAACGALGYRARRRARPGWRRPHLVAMAASYVTLLTAFYVDNGARLPVWRSLPHLAYWTLPALVAAPLVARALWRYRLRPAAPRPPRSGATPGPPG